MLEAELNNEKSRGSVDMSAMDSRMKVIIIIIIIIIITMVIMVQGEYEALLRKELHSLRKLYKANMKQSQEEFMRTYNQKLADLERALAHEKRLLFLHLFYIAATTPVCV